MAPLEVPSSAHCIFNFTCRTQVLKQSFQNSYSIVGYTLTLNFELDGNFQLLKILNIFEFWNWPKDFGNISNLELGISFVIKKDILNHCRNSV